LVVMLGGYAFSQEEQGVVDQVSYDTRNFVLRSHVTHVSIL